jgi:hypothetical protein
MSVSDPGEKIEWGADSEPQKNERVPSSGPVRNKWSKDDFAMVLHGTLKEVKKHLFSYSKKIHVCSRVQTKETRLKQTQRNPIPLLFIQNRYAVH